MGKLQVEKEIGYAYDAIREAGIPDSPGKVKKAYRSQVSSFGAALMTSGLRMAVCFYSQKASEGAAQIDRTKLLDAILIVLKKSDPKTYRQFRTLREAVVPAKSHDQEITMRDDIVDAATAVKLAFNLYELVGPAIEDSE